MIDSIPATTAAICFIACHGGPADHFAAFTEKLNQDSPIVQIYVAEGPAVEKFYGRNIAVHHIFSVDKISETEKNELAEAIAKACSTASVVITDVGHTFNVAIHRALAKQGIRHLAYYDNPEPFVPGGYSSTASDVMLAAQGVLFANSNLVSEPLYRAPQEEVELGTKKTVGIGYYPIAQAEIIKARREDISKQAILRTKLFNAVGLPEAQKTCVYFGGNNEEYFIRAFPAFLSILATSMKQFDLSNLAIVLHQHPGAKAANRDRHLFEEWQKTHDKDPHCPSIIFSTLNSDDAQVVADLAMYYQTSMGPQFALAGIPTMQVGHEPYRDILVKNGLTPAVTSAVQFNNVIAALTQGEVKKPSTDLILKALGIQACWVNILKGALKL